MAFASIKKGARYLKRHGIKKSMKKLSFKIANFRNNNRINGGYEEWMKNNEPNEKELNNQRNLGFKNNPLISIVIPMYNTDIIFFEELVKSLKAQTYENFEVCLADGSKEENKTLLDIIGNDSRFNYKFLNENKGISGNSNEALKLAKGEYVALVDHDDILLPFALFEVVKAINENDDPDFIYSDEDILMNGKRCNPHFKPDYSPDTLRSYNYICHLSVFKKDLLDKIGNFNKKYDGAQDYDIILRATENANKIVHISKILYNWRSHVSSTAGNSDSKNYVIEAGKNAIKDHLDRLNIKGCVSEEEEPGRYRIKYNLIGEPKVSILIPSKDNVLDLKKCIDSIITSTYSNYEIIVIENNSDKKETFKYYKELEEKHDNVKIVTIEIDKFNFSRINNLGAKEATGEYLLFLNNDTQVITSSWIEEMLGLCQREDVGIVGAKLLYPDKTVQHAGVILGMGGVAGHTNTNIKDSDPGYFSRAAIINNYSSVTAACLMMKRKTFDEIEGFEEKLEVAFNDIDLCMKVRKLGLLVVYTPYAKLFHYESKSRGYEDSPEKKKRFSREMELFKTRWEEEIEKKDPYFNSNLRLDINLVKVDGRKKGEY